MGWVRYNDDFHDDPKVAAIMDGCPEALALHLLASTWTARNRRQGFVPAVLTRRLVGPNGDAWAAALVAAGLWDVVDGGWRFHDWNQHRGGYWPWERPNRPGIAASIRDAVFRRDGHMCQACDATRDLTLDHIVPYSHGGPDTVDNLRVLCRSCNSSRGAGRW